MASKNTIADLIAEHPPLPNYKGDILADAIFLALWRLGGHAYNKELPSEDLFEAWYQKHQQGGLSRNMFEDARDDAIEKMTKNPQSNLIVRIAQTATPGQLYQAFADDPAFLRFAVGLFTMQNIAEEKGDDNFMLSNRTAAELLDRYTSPGRPDATTGRRAIKRMVGLGWLECVDRGQPAMKEDKEKNQKKQQGRVGMYRFVDASQEVAPF